MERRTPCFNVPIPVSFNGADVDGAGPDSADYVPLTIGRVDVERDTTGVLERVIGLNLLLHSPIRRHTVNNLCYP